VRALALAALVGVVHVHHAPSHDSDAPFEEVLEAALATPLDFLVLTEHVEPETEGPLPAAEHAGVFPRPDGGRLLVLVGVEIPTRDGHLLALDVPHVVTAGERPGREVIEEIHALGGFAVVAHPFTHGGWHDWGADFDGLEVHSQSSDFRRFLGPLFPLHLLRFAFSRESVLEDLLVRPERELAKWDELLSDGRRVVAFSGADAHCNVSLLGWRLDPYAQAFRTVQTICPDVPLAEDAIWKALRGGRCRIRYSLYEPRADEVREVEFPSGRRELQLDAGRRVLEIGQPPAAP
jgi:hypothetical protein